MKDKATPPINKTNVLIQVPLVIDKSLSFVRTAVKKHHLSETQHCLLQLLLLYTTTAVISQMIYLGFPGKFIPLAHKPFETFHSVVNA